MINWTRCTDAMPDTVGEYLVCYEILGHQHISIAYINDDVFEVFDIQGDHYELQEPTHWSELNKPLGVVTCTNNIQWEIYSSYKSPLENVYFLTNHDKYLKSFC